MFSQRVLGCFTGCGRIPLPMTARLIFCHAGHRVSFALTSQNTESSWQAENKIGILAVHKKTIQQQGVGVTKSRATNDLFSDFKQEDYCYCYRYFMFNPIKTVKLSSANLCQQDFRFPFL